MAKTGLASGRRERWAARENARRQAWYRANLAAWQRVDDELARLLALARSFTGYAAGEEPGEIRLILRRQERMFCQVPRVALVRVRRPPGTSASGYSGYSALDTARLADAAGHRPQPRRREPRRVLEIGPATVTDQRVVFHGPERDREWSFAALRDVEHGTGDTITLFHATNREELSGLAYTRAQAPLLRFMIALARAHAAGDVPGLVARIEADRARHAARRPTRPRPVTPEEAPGLVRVVLAAIVTVYFGRPGQPLRWRLVQFVAAVIATAGVVTLTTPYLWVQISAEGRPAGWAKVVAAGLILQHVPPRPVAAAPHQAVGPPPGYTPYGGEHAVRTPR